MAGGNNKSIYFHPKSNLSILEILDAITDDDINVWYHTTMNMDDVWLQDLDEIVSRAKAVHSGRPPSQDVVMDDAPNEFVASCKVLLEE